LAGLLKNRNAIDDQITKVIHRPMTSGHAGEWIASKIFDITLEAGAAHPAYDGHFQSGQLAGKTVNVKWYLRQEGVLDMTTSPTLDYYLVMTGPWHSAAIDTRTRPWVIDYVYLFDAHKLLDVKQGQGVKIGIATSLRKDEWNAAEIYPSQTSEVLRLDPEQTALLRLFTSDDASNSGA
jgi:hypothetical protein